jgi:hypothetical protein
MRSALLIAATACVLAGCQQKTGTTTVTTNSQTGEVTTSGTGAGAQAVKLQPGEWEVKVQVNELKMASMPNAPATPPAITSKVCITPEQASKGPGDFLKQAKMDCTATTSSFAGGRITAEMTCKMPGGGAGEMRSKTSGSYTPTSMTTDAEVSMTGPMTMSQKVHTEAKRIGDCPAGK